MKNVWGLLLRGITAVRKPSDEQKTGHRTGTEQRGSFARLRELGQSLPRDLQSAGLGVGNTNSSSSSPLIVWVN